MGKNQPTELWVDDITGDSAADVTFALPLMNTAHSNPVTNRDGIDTRFRKMGPGTLSLASADSDFTGDVSVVEGTLMIAVQKHVLNPTTSAWGNTQAPHQFFIGTNALLNVATKDAMGQGASTPLIEIVVSGGTLSQMIGTANVYGPLTFDNATLVYSGKDGSWGAFIFEGNVTFKGTNAYNLALVNDSRILCGCRGMIYFDVADILGTNVDVTIGMPIQDCPAWVAGGVPARPSRVGKKGAGTLRLSSSASTFTGNVDVAEGVLQLPIAVSGINVTSSCVGNPQVSGRQLLARSDAELDFMNKDVLGQFTSSIKMATVISNATLRLADNTVNVFGPLSFYNAKIIYQSGLSDSRTWGVMGFGSNVEFDGANAYVFATEGNYDQFSLG